MRAEEKLYLINEILECYYDYTEIEIGYKEGIIDAINTIINFDKEEDDGMNRKYEFTGERRKSDDTETGEEEKEEGCF